MRPRIAIIAALALTLPLVAARRNVAGITATSRAASPAPEAGLLVGLAGGRTLWFVSDGDSMRLAWQGPRLVVPRRDGWWFVASAERCGLDIDNAHGGGGIAYDYAFRTRYQAVAMARAGSTVDIPLYQTMDCAAAAATIDSARGAKYKAALDSVKGDSSKVEWIPPPGDVSEPGMDCVESGERVTFLTSAVVAIEERYSETEHCAPGGYATSGSNAVRRIADDSAVALRPMLSPAVRRRAERARHHEEGDGSCAFEDTPERLDDSWIVRRSQGRWIVDLWLDGPNVCRGGSDYEVDVELPRHFTGEPPLPVAWSALAKRFPMLQDASVSPSGAFMLLLAPDTLTVHRLRGTSVGAPLVRADSIRYEGIVMIRWATAAEAARWTRALPTLVPPTVRVVDGCPGCDK